MQYAVVLLIKLPVGNNKQPNFEWRGGGGGGVWIVLFYEVTSFEDKVSTILSLIVRQQAKQYLNNLKCNNCMMLSYCGFHSFTPPHNIVIRIMFSVTLSQHHHIISFKVKLFDLFCCAQTGCNNNILYFYQDVWRINLDLVKFYDYDKLILSILQKLTVLRFNVKMWKSPNLLNFEIVKNQTQLKSSGLFYCFFFWCSTQLAIKKWEIFLKYVSMTHAD